MKTEIRKKGSAGSMEAWSYAQYAGETEREKTHQKKHSISNNALTQCTYVCVQCTLLYKSFEGLTEVLSYFNALKERLH